MEEGFLDIYEGWAVVLGIDQVKCGEEDDADGSGSLKAAERHTRIRLVRRAAIIAYITL